MGKHLIFCRRDMGNFFFIFFLMRLNSHSHDSARCALLHTNKKQNTGSNLDVINSAGGKSRGKLLSGIYKYEMRLNLKQHSVRRKEQLLCPTNADTKIRFFILGVCQVVRLNKAAPRRAQPQSEPLISVRLSPRGWQFHE